MADAKMQIVVAVFFVATSVLRAHDTLVRLLSGKCPRPEGQQMTSNLEQMIRSIVMFGEAVIPGDACTDIEVALQRLAEAAAAVMAFPLSTDVEIAQVFVP
jgi:hypothetical protein